MSELTIHNIANGGDGVARDADGRVVFVAGALPGERVRVELTGTDRRFARARVLEVLDAHPQRVTPPCAHLAEGCGGCDLQHVDAALALELKARIVADAIERIGRVSDPRVTIGGAVASTAYRTTVRAAIDGDRAGFRARGSHDVVAAPNCLVAHPTIARVLAEGRFPGAAEITVRVGARTGDCLTVVTPAAAGSTVPTGALVGADADGWRSIAITEEAAGRTWQVSAGSFFQSCPEAAELLVDTVDEAIGSDAIDHLVDLYAGVGLFAGTVGAGAHVTAVESNAAAAADARVNLAGDDVEVVRCRVERWRPVPADVVIADPARTGLGADGVAKVVATGASKVVLVSCDAGSLGRDVGLLHTAGYRLDRATVLDLFPMTSHVEVVSVLTRR